MSKRKIEEILSIDDKKLRINKRVLNNLIGDTQAETIGILELGPTMMNITKGLKRIAQEKDDCIKSETKLVKYTIAMIIHRSVFNNAVQFIEIESNFTKPTILSALLDRLEYNLPNEEKINKQKKTKYIFTDDEDPNLFLLDISENHAYIYISESDGECYENNYTDAIKFIYRKNPEKNPFSCSIM